ncbi:hypothetical protein BPTFM16_01871 [Altererythrobacter insulae]|nr:hypothetical protein BPTFM16_01871 [Altererythrobacter insulae]
MSEKGGKQIFGSADWIERLSQPTRITQLSPIAQRFIFSLRLIAVHRKAGRDPVGELTTRLGSVSVAIKTLQLVEICAQAWSDPVQVRRCCCQMTSHDELTLSTALDSARSSDRGAFDQNLSDLLSREVRDAIWIAASELVIAEFS